MFNANNKDEQVEFFDDLAGRAKKPKKRRFACLGKIALSLSYESLMILCIGLIMLLIVCYSLGVERGRQLARLKSEGVITAQEQEKPKTTTPKPKKRVRVEVARAKAEVKTSPYIQVATFRTDKYANIEIRRLKGKGYQPFLLTKGNFREVCVGGYSNKDEAREALKQLRKLYADCILRHR